MCVEPPVAIGGYAVTLPPYAVRQSGHVSLFP